MLKAITQPTLITRHPLVIKIFTLHQEHPYPLTDQALSQMQHPHQHKLTTEKPQDLAIQLKERLQVVTGQNFLVPKTNAHHKAEIDAIRDIRDISVT